MDYASIKYYEEGAVAVIKFDRADVLNSFNKEMGKEVRDALSKARDNKEARSILITGEGRGFCAGQDLAEAVPPDGQPMADIAELIRENYNPIVKLIRGIEKPIIAGVNGVAAGAGANIGLACDIVVASEKASFIQAFSKIGLVPDSGGTYYLPRLVGTANATALMMLGDKVTANEAKSMGMIYKVLPEDDFYNQALEFAKYVAGLPTKALGLIKNMVNQSFNNTFDEQLQLEEEMQVTATQTHDYLEGVKAFQEKRKPEFKGE